MRREYSDPLRQGISLTKREKWIILIAEKSFVFSRSFDDGQEVPMKILVLNGSPAGENSITLQTVRYLEQLCRKAPEFSVALHMMRCIR